MTSPLADLITAQPLYIPLWVLEDLVTAETSIKAEKLCSQDSEADGLGVSIPPPSKLVVELARGKVVPLGHALPIGENGFTLQIINFRVTISFRYGWTPCISPCELPLWSNLSSSTCLLLSQGRYSSLRNETPLG